MLYNIVLVSAIHQHGQSVLWAESSISLKKSSPQESPERNTDLPVPWGEHPKKKKKSTWISHRYTYISSLLNLPFTSFPDSKLSQSTRSEFPTSHSKFTLTIYTYVSMFFNVTLLIHPLSHSPTVSTNMFSLLSLHCCSTSMFISTIYLHFTYMCKYMTFVFLFLTSVFIIGCRFIDLIRTDSNMLYICSITSLSIHQSMDI